ncbi:hypothetical protein J6590_012404, partial [Homalodisca vitripennis]
VSSSVASQNELISKHPFKGSRVSTAIPCQTLSKETRRSDSRSTVPAWDPLSTPSETVVSLEEGKASSEPTSPVKVGRGWHTLMSRLARPVDT